jgi:hypothetical protein
MPQILFVYKQMSVAQMSVAQMCRLTAALAAVSPSIYFVYRKALCYSIDFPGMTAGYGEMYNVCTCLFCVLLELTLTCFVY